MANTVSGFDVWWSGLVSNVKKLVEEWKLGSPTSELACRNSLYDYLLKRMPEARIRKEYRDGGTTCDIHVFWKGAIFDSELFIEIKFDLVKPGEFQRLIGQITELEPARRRVMVILCGQTELHFLKRLREHFGRHEDTLFDGIAKTGGIDFLTKMAAPVASENR